MLCAKECAFPPVCGELKIGYLEKRKFCGTYFIETRLDDWVAGWVTNWSVVGRGQGSEAGREEGKEGEVVAVHYN